MPPSNRIRAVVAVRLAWSAVLGLTAARPGRPGAKPLVSWTARALALRHVLESAILVRHADDRPPRWTVTVDCLHAVSMVAVAAVSRSLRGPALRSAAAATAISAVTARARQSH